MVGNNREIVELIDFENTHLKFDTKLNVGSILIGSGGKMLIAGLAQGKGKTKEDRRPGAVRA